MMMAVLSKPSPTLCLLIVLGSLLGLARQNEALIVALQRRSGRLVVVRHGMHPAAPLHHDGGAIAAFSPSSATVALGTMMMMAPPRQQQQIGGEEEEEETDERTNSLSSRRNLLHRIAAGSAAVGTALAAAGPARADVSDGNALPKEAQQFANVIKLKANLKDVRKRLTTAAAGDIDKKEWDNVGRFLRAAYATAENDMRAVAKGVSSADSRERALKDVDQVKKYAQAGDASVNKQDAAGLASLLAKMAELVDDFLDSLSDVPDEI